MQPCKHKHIVNFYVHRTYSRQLATETRTMQTKPHFALTPCFSACLAMLAERVMSSYELLVQLPMSAGESVGWCMCEGVGGWGGQ